MKGQIYQAKRNTKIHYVISLIFGGVVTYGLYNLFTFNVKPDDPNLSLYTGLGIFFGIVSGLSFLLMGISLIWNNVNKRNTKLQIDRYLHHYNRCIEHFKNKEYDKIKIIYNNFLKDQDMFKPLTARIRLAYRAAKHKDLEKEMLIGKTSPELKE